MSVLPKVVAALTKHLSPVASSSSAYPEGRGADRPALRTLPRPNDSRGRREGQQQPPPPREGFRRFDSQQASVATPPQATASVTAPASPAPAGVASALLDLFEKIRQTGAQLARLKAWKTYAKASEKKTEHARFKRGSMIDTKGG